MSIRMHQYEDGRTGLAAFCDVCEEQITEHGYVVWNPDNIGDWLVVHQARCDPGGKYGYGYSMPLDAELVYLANSTGIDLEKAKKRVGIFASLD